jgi:hypothetical protein
MKKSEYYFVLKSEIEDFFPCRIIKQHNNSCFEIENLETGAKENLIDGRHYKTEIDVRFEKRAQQINSFIEKKELFYILSYLHWEKIIQVFLLKYLYF